MDEGRVDEIEVAHQGRNETTKERADRRWTELLQELRVARRGVQILFGFLLAVVFQPPLRHPGGLGQDDLRRDRAAGLGHGGGADRPGVPPPAADRTQYEA